ncbi:MAG: methyltransferase domain-containing protein [Patescibacteria group bacterium]|nr:methyltransferase domain-containing protein [Patescibacteria group bacterium]
MTSSFNKENRIQGEEIETQDYVSEFYENKRYNKPYSLHYHNWLAQKMFSLLDLGSPILDNGCGNGFLAQFLKKHEAVGLDISPKMVELARKRYSEVILGDSQNIPFEDSYFQIVINRGLLHHLPDPRQGVFEIRRVLKNRGQAIFIEPISSFLSVIPRMIARQGKHFSKSHKNFKEKELKKIINSQLKIEEIHYFGYLAYVLLGFPDIFDIYKFLPGKSILTPALIEFDELIAKVPLLNHQAWGIMILARKQND